MGNFFNNMALKTNGLRILLLLGFSMVLSSASHADMKNFCDNLPRPAYADFQKDKSSNDWFEVYEVDAGIWAIYEPYQWQEVISYLIVGSKTALLFDTGNGIGNIKAIVDQLTNKPIVVLNSHTHFDHIGGNHLFDNIQSVSTAFTMANSKGLKSDMITGEASAMALCKKLPEGVTQENHHIEPFAITKQVKDGDIIDLGDRKIEILHIPGHTDDSIVLLDREAGFMWTGDSFYEGPIWLYFPETDLAAYKKSIARLAALAPQLKALFPAHNTPKVDPSSLVKTQKAFDLVLKGEAKATPDGEGVVIFKFDGFSFLMREDYTSLSTE